MSLLDEIAAEVRGPGGRCSVGNLIPQLSAEDRGQLSVALWTKKNEDEFKYSAPSIAKALRQRGYEVNNGAVQRHRRRACACPIS